jgi:hypothetical protein
VNAEQDKLPPGRQLMYTDFVIGFFLFICLICKICACQITKYLY